MIKQSLISIVIPCYNDSEYIEQSIHSALEQTYENKEIIVVDDGSDIKTKGVLKKFESRVTKLITQHNKGLSTARNVGIKASAGDLILVLDSDDYFEPTFCEKAEIIYRENFPRYKIITCQATRFNEKGIIDIFTPRGGGIKDFLFSSSAIGNSLFSKKDWEKVNGYDETMFGYEDWDFFIRLLSQSGEAFVIQEPLFNYRQKKTSMRLEANKIKFDHWKFLYLKHQYLYKEHYTLLIDHLIGSLKQLEYENIKNINRIEYRLGKAILKPLRSVKLFLAERINRGH